MIKDNLVSTKRQVHTPKKESTRSITYRLPEKLVTELELKQLREVYLKMYWLNKFWKNMFNGIDFQIRLE